MGAQRATPELRLVATTPDPSPTPSAEYTYEMWIEDLQGIVWNAFIKGRMSLEELAARASLHETTVERFAWRDTKKPAARTVFQIAQAVDFRIPFIDCTAPRQPAEQDFSSFRSLIPEPRKKA